MNSIIIKSPKGADSLDNIRELVSGKNMIHCLSKFVDDDKEFKSLIHTSVIKADRNELLIDTKSSIIVIQDITSSSPR